MDLPPDITAIPQNYKVKCIIPGGEDRDTDFNFLYDADIKLATDICSFNCTNWTTISDSVPSPSLYGLLTVTWTAENINIGNNDGDHRISCSAESNDTLEYITVRGSSP